MPKDMYEYLIREMEENKDKPYAVSHEFGSELFTYAKEHYANAQMVNYNGVDFICLTEEAKYQLFLHFERLRKKLWIQMAELKRVTATIICGRR